jgi:superfamily II DNA/RNA helicase
MSALIEDVSSLKRNEYDNKLDEFRQSLEQFETRSEEWMGVIFREWLAIQTPHPWQISFSLNLFKGQEVFLTARTGSGKSILTLAPVIARKIAKKDHTAVVVYPTESLIIDQVSITP